MMAHPHKKAIESMPSSALIGIIEESKMTYVRENLSIFLHESQVKMLKQVKKHDKPHHKRIRVSRCHPPPGRGRSAPPVPPRGK